MKWAFLITVFISVHALGATLEYKRSGALSRAIEEVLYTLPSDYLDSVKDVVSIKVISFKSDAIFDSENLCRIQEGVKFGSTHFRSITITISSRLVELAEKNSNQFDCGHGTFENMLKAVIIHELTHVKDNAEKISLKPDFQRIVGMKRVQGSSKRKTGSQNVSVSPDAYEYKNLEEALAVNAEYLVLDSEFECRRPATANFLSRNLGIALKGECQKNHNILVQSAFVEDSYTLPGTLDPRRIYQIHYLFAGKGQALMSRWGHSMFRLIVCAPFRKMAGPECLDDISHHLVLSYRASMSDLNISYTKGMFGKYPSQLFIMRFLEIQQEYTKYELRDLYSAPLKMTTEQKKDFLDLTMERFWTYQGKYYFLDNNCGTETAKHLSFALSDEESKLIGSITPLKIYKDILKKENELTDGNLDGLSRTELINHKYLIISMFDELNKSYQFLRQYLASFDQPDFKHFLKKTNAKLRLEDYDTFMSEEMDMKLKKQIVMKLSHLERYLTSKYLMSIPKKAIEKMDSDEDLKAEVMKMGQSLKLMNLQPWEVINSKYGVPTSLEFNLQFPNFKQKRIQALEKKLDSQMSDLQKILGKKHFAKELAEIEDLKKIKILTQNLINQVNNNLSQEDL